MISSEVYSEVKKLEIETNRIINSYFAGEYQSAFKGRGVEFEEVRPYVEGDEVRFIDWNVTAKLNQLFVKRFKEERELSVFLLVDLSASMYFGSKTDTKHELMLKVAALLSLVAMKNNDRAGLIIFTDRVHKVIMPRKGRKHVLCLIRDLVAFEPGQSKTDLRLPLELINKVFKKRSIVFVLSDFKTDGYQKALEITAKKHDVVPIVIRDGLEQSIPSGKLFLRLEDLESGQKKLIYTGDKDFLQSYLKTNEKHHQELDKYFLKNKIDSIELNTGEYYLPALLRYFKRRTGRRQC